jgi:subtilase family serine protease
MKTSETKINVSAAGFALVLGFLMAASADSTPTAPLSGAIDPRTARQLPLPTNIDPNRVRVAVGLPDLTFTRAHVARSASDGKYRVNTVNFCVKNIGTGAASEFTSALFANTVVGDTGRPPGGIGGDSLASFGHYFATVPALAPQQEHCGSFVFKTKGAVHNGPSFFDATTNARLIVDRSRRIVESNEGNNEATPTVVTSAP